LSFLIACQLLRALAGLPIRQLTFGLNNLFGGEFRSDPLHGSLHYLIAILRREAVPDPGAHDVGFPTISPLIENIADVHLRIGMTEISIVTICADCLMHGADSICIIDNLQS
jgi:hypothetical protein